jgi:hypothetical protein
MRKLNFVLLILSLGFSVNKTGTTAAKFLSINPGGKAVGMGGAFTSLADDASSLYWNPSGISRLGTYVFYFNHSEWLADINYDFVGLSIPFNGGSTLGLSITYLSMGEMKIRRYDDEETGETFKAGSYALSTTWAMNLTDRFSIGFTGKYIREKIDNSHASGFAVDVGTLFNTIFGPQLGVSISNFGPKMTMTGTDLLVNADVSNIEGNNPNINAELSTDPFDLPLVLRVGLSNHLKFGGLTSIWSVDAVNPIDNSEYLNAGIELNFWDMAFCRMGAKSIFMDEREELYTAGLGSKFKLFSGQNLVVDYSYEIFKYLPSTHQFSIGLNY